MLAWVHQSLAGEREVLVQLLGEDAAGGPGEGGAPPAAEVPSIAELLDRIFESICKPLQVAPHPTTVPPQTAAVHVRRCLPLSPSPSMTPRPFPFDCRLRSFFSPDGLLHMSQGRRQNFSNRWHLVPDP